MGGLVDVVVAYETVRPPSRAEEVRQLLVEGDISCITFTSSSTVENFAAMFPDEDLLSLVGNTVIACIGPITAETARRYGLEVTIMTVDYTIDALASEIVKYFSHE